jgi:hypothetical protein
MHQLQAMVMAEVVNMRRLQGLEQAEAVDYKASTEFVRKNLLMKMKNVSYLKKNSYIRCCLLVRVSRTLIIICIFK